MARREVRVPVRLILDPLGELHLVPTKPADALDSRFIFNLSGSKVGLSLYIFVVGSLLSSSSAEGISPTPPLPPPPTNANPL